MEDIRPYRFEDDDEGRSEEARADREAAAERERESREDVPFHIPRD